MRIKNLLFVAVLFSSLFSAAQKNYTSADIYQAVKKLNVLGSVLYIAAHPDDENTRLLTYFSKDRMYKTGYLSITRGDGGQNLIGNEQGIELGLVRTQELLAARRIDGGEQFFTRAYDFGFSKTPDETFSFWDKEKILADVVWVIRKFQPDVIITRFPTTGEGGHGHHTASAILANEAFTAAADPKRFPEQLKYVETWQAKRIAWNSFNFGGNNTTRDDHFRFDVGGYNPLLGKSYGEIAADSRSMHKSQGFGVARTRGEALEFFKLTGGAPFTNDLFEDINTGWGRSTLPSDAQKMISSILAGFDFTAPHKSVNQLMQLLRFLQNAPPSQWRDQKLKETKEVIEMASGLWAEVFTSQPNAVHLDSLKFTITVNDRSGIGAELRGVKSDLIDSNFSVSLKKNTNFTQTKSILVPASKPITQPYWLEENMSPGYYNVSDQQLIGQPDVQPSYMVDLEFMIGGEKIIFTKPLVYKYTDPVKGEQYQPLVVLPSFTVATAGAVTAVRDDTKFVSEVFNYTAQKNNSRTTIYSGDNIVVDDQKPLSKSSSREYNLPFELSKYRKNKQSDTFSIRYYERPGVAAKNLYSIRYDHIPHIHYFTDAVNRYSVIDVKTRGKKIGYIVGAGDKVPEALEQMDYEVTLLHEKELARNNLKQFDAIITGIRAYNTNEWLNRYHEKLMKYVEDGGNLIVQYNTSNQIGPVRARIGPYPFNISRNRITNEKAPVTFALPDHIVLNYPNKITQSDFNNWIQERSIYHATDYGNNFQSILRMNDPGEAPNDGSLIIARHGKGYFTYTGIVFFRQLPAGVPGAYRLLANLIALNQKKEM